MSEYAIIVYTYHCDDCSKTTKLIVDFDDRLKQKCATCGKDMRFKGGCDARQSSVGNCGYTSFEKQAKINEKRVGKETIDKMIAEDPVVSKRKAAAETPKPWFYPNDKTPTEVNRIKDKDKYIQTGES